MTPREAGADAIAATRKRLEPHAHLGAEYAHVYVPCVPAPDPIVNKDVVDAAAPLPEVLRRPLLKVADGHTPAPIQAVRSGGETSPHLGCVLRRAVPRPV